jgi:hypothetical protein
MSSDDIEPYDWYRRVFGRSRGGLLEDMFRALHLQPTLNTVFPNIMIVALPYFFLLYFSAIFMPSHHEMVLSFNYI